MKAGLADHDVTLFPSYHSAVPRSLCSDIVEHQRPFVQSAAIFVAAMPTVVANWLQQGEDLEVTMNGDLDDVFCDPNDTWEKQDRVASPASISPFL